MYGDMHCGKPQELKNQIGPESEAARFRVVRLGGPTLGWVG